MEAQPNAWNIQKRSEHKDNFRHANAHMRGIRTTTYLLVLSLAPSLALSVI